jgi:hypothetical protein
VLIYLDESGCLGFDFTKQGTSKFFVITLLVIPHATDAKKMEKAVERTLKHKILKKKTKRQKAGICELKGSKTDISVKKYFLKKATESGATFRIYSVALNKSRVNEALQKRPKKLYNFISNFLINKCRFDEIQCGVTLFVDRSKGVNEQRDFNQYLAQQLEVRLPTKVPFRVFHNDSVNNKCLQAVDLFCWGFGRSYERDDKEWLELYKNKVAFDGVYLPPKKERP